MAKEEKSLIGVKLSGLIFGPVLLATSMFLVGGVLDMGYTGLKLISEIFLPLMLFIFSFWWLILALKNIKYLGEFI